MFSVARRLVAGRVSLGVEFDLRNRMYAHLQSLELAFFDDQQTGQLMSRSTVDLQSVRFFLGYGLIFIAQSMITILIAADGDDRRQPAARAGRPRAHAGRDLGRRPLRAANRPASQEVQQRIAELTAEAEENIGGVGWSRRSRRRRGSWRASATRSGACSTSRWSRPGCAPSTTR